MQAACGLQLVLVESWLYDTEHCGRVFSRGSPCKHNIDKTYQYMFLMVSFLANATHHCNDATSKPKCKGTMVIVFHPRHIASHTLVDTERCSMPPLYRINLCGHCGCASYSDAFIIILFNERQCKAMSVSKFMPRASSKLPVGCCDRQLQEQEHWQAPGKCNRLDPNRLTWIRLW